MFENYSDDEPRKLFLLRWRQFLTLLIFVSGCSLLGEQTYAKAIFSVPVPVRYAIGDVEGLKMDVKGFKLTGLTFRAPENFVPLLKPFVGPGKRFQDLLDAAAGVARLLRGDGLFLCEVYVPEQKLDAGVVELLVVEGRWGDIKLETVGKVSLKRDLLLPYIEGLKEGNLITAYGAERAIALLRAHMGKHISIYSSIEPGINVGTADLILRFEDVKKDAGSARFKSGLSKPVLRRFNLPLGQPAIDDSTGIHGPKSCEDGIVNRDGLVCQRR